MATPGATQALLGAFFFGILFNAASAALALYVIGHGSAIFRDGLRLVLILFLLSSAAWALVEFLATIIEPTSGTSCQVAAVFSSVFDQLGKIFIEQYLVWATRAEGKKAGLSLVPQILLVGRFGVGMAFIGLTGNEFSPTCVPISKITPVAITTIVLDGVIFGLLAIQVLSMGPTKDSASSPRAPKKSVGMVVIGLGIWIGMSAVLVLGMKSTALVLKTTLPALGLAILVALVTVLSGTLVIPRGPPPRRPDSPMTRDMGRDLSSSDSAEYPPSRYEDVKGATTTTMALAAYAAPNDGSMPAVSFPITPTPGADQGRVKKYIKTKGTTGKLVISKPVIVEQEGMNNPLQRIPTVDLATAANYERERRIRLAQRGSTLIAQRPAPQPPTAEGQNGILSREISTRRKQVAPATLAQLERSASTKTTKTSTGLSVEANASSTSSELSPGTEKVRRRSPRQPPVSSIPSTFQPIRPGDPIRIPIPRPRTPPESPKPESVKTPLQRRPTIGLPSNPRAQAMKAAGEAENQRQETVMFVNNIVYDDPSAVDSIVQGASKTPMAPLNSRDSVVNRPRPIPRKGDKDRQVFPAELSPSQNHRRSKSVGSATSRKSILQSMPGSPTQLPPLPPPPKSAGIVQRPLPNDTKSMTFDEKMNFLYSTPLSAASVANAAEKRRSEVPQIPPLPATYMVDAQPPKAESIPEPDSISERRISKTTDRSSIRTTSILGIEDIPQRLMPKADSSRNAVDEVGQSWLPGISAENERQKRPSDEKSNRKSSPVIPEVSHFSVSSMKTESRVRDDDRSTVWGSVHSPVAAIDMQQARRLNARSTYIQNSQNSRISEEPVGRSSYANIPDEVMEVMLETSDSPVDQQKSPEKAVQELPTFHHRVGEECPAFSTRKDKIRSRKMPPPAPLALSRNNSKKAIIIQPAEPSPLESPEVAYQMIQAQLQKFEQPNRDSNGSQGGRLALLENLEREMGQLENRWQNRVDRDSISSIGTTTSKGSRPPSIAERRASRKASLRNAALRSKSQETTGTPSSQSSGTSSENTQASAWQTRLAEAQMEYMKSTPDLLTKRNNLNFLAVSKAALGSPSPPDTDESDYDDEIPGSVQQLQPTVFKPATQVHELWKPQSPVQYPVSSGLWAGVAKKSERASEVNELPGLSVRPAIRKAQDSLLIESSRLWEKPAKNSSTSAMEGLWKKFDPSGSSGAATRRTTIRPPRRNKRATLLPDILENPEPLPDKRGTLGLFQFPWGEKSENASIQPRPARTFMAMPGTMTTGGPKINAVLEARSKQLEAEEFTTSFFDDYEAEEEGDNFDFSDSDNEGDDFDESTLWEIANLLKSENVPSKNSLLPLPLQSPDYANSPVSSTNVVEQPAEEYRDDGLVLEEPIPADRLPRPTSESTFVQPLLWAQPEALAVNIVGLPQPDSPMWKSYIAKPAKMARSKSQSEDIPPIESNDLWKPKPNNGKMTGTGLLWSASKPAHEASVAVPKMKAVAHNKSLWVRPIATLTSDIRGLFSPSHSRADYRRTSKVPAALVMERKPRVVEVRLEKLASRSLWTGKAATKSSLMWEKPSVIYATERDGLFDSNEARSDFRRTTKEPAAISTKRVVRTIEKPLARLDTNNLWSPEIITSPQSVKGAQLFVSKKSKVAAQSADTNKVQSIPLWRKPETRTESENEGLFDASVVRINYRSTSQAPAAISMPKKPRVSKEPLPVLTTTSLWTGVSSESESESAVPAAELIETREVPVSIITKSMWEKPASPISSSYFEGLFDSNVARVDYRRTSKLPAAIDMTRTPRKMEESLPTPTSTKLWEKQSKSSYIPPSTNVSLWSNPILSMPASSGLFQVDPTRKVYRTTSAEPAALQMVRKPRAVDAPIPRLESTRLWTRSQITSVEVDWISISSVGPKSPSIVSESDASSAPSSPMSDSSSAKTSTTKASSAKSFFSGLFGRKKKEPEASKAPKDSPKAEPEIPAVPELPKEFVVKNLDEVSYKKPHTPLRKLHRQSVAFRADWDGALREAIAASYPGTMVALRASYPQDWEAELKEAIKASRVPVKLTRKPASPRAWSVALQKAIVASYPEIRFSRGQTLPGQWTAELQDAISRSYPSQVEDYDVAVRHPVFMGSMETTAETVHPAIGPKVSRSRGNSRSNVAQPATFDVAVRHPVFFGSMETTAQSVHPAIPEKTQKQGVSSEAMAVPLLWSKPAATESATEGHLWNANSSAPELQETSFNAEIDMAHNPRKAKDIVQSPELKIDFSGQSTWRRSEKSQPQNRDWLDDSMKKRFSRVELRY